MFNVDVVTNETVLIEPSFPIVLDTNGDKLSVGYVASTVNVFITGDKEDDNAPFRSSKGKDSIVVTENLLKTAPVWVLVRR